MRARTTAVLVVVATALLAAYLLVRAVDLLSTGGVKGIGLGVGVVLLVGLGTLLVAGEVRLGAASQRLGRRLYDDGFTEQDLPRTASGRLDRDAVDALFAVRKAETEAAPEDWRAWFKLALAYDAAGDAQRGRRAMRKAVSLERAEAS